jgi:hypothetical protein
MRLEVVREALRKSPFQTFTFKLADGRALLVDHPEMISLGRHVIYLISVKDSTYTMLDPLLIVSVDYENVGRATLPPTFRHRRDEDFGQQESEE